MRAQVLAGAVAVPVLGFARRGRPERHSERRRHILGPDRLAVGAGQRVGQHRATTGPPVPAQDICHRRQNRQGEIHEIHNNCTYIA